MSSVTENVIPGVPSLRSGWRLTCNGALLQPMSVDAHGALSFGRAASSYVGCKNRLLTSGCLPENAQVDAHGALSLGRAAPSYVGCKNRLLTSGCLPEKCTHFSRRQSCPPQNGQSPGWLSRSLFTFDYHPGLDRESWTPLSVRKFLSPSPWAVLERRSAPVVEPAGLAVVGRRLANRHAKPFFQLVSQYSGRSKVLLGPDLPSVALALSRRFTSCIRFSHS